MAKKKYHIAQKRPKYLDNKLTKEKNKLLKYIRLIESFHFYYLSDGETSILGNPPKCTVQYLYGKNGQKRRAVTTRYYAWKTTFDNKTEPIIEFYDEFWA